MKKIIGSSRKRLAQSVSAITLGFLIASAAQAQTNTSNIRGNVASVAQGTQVTVRNLQTGFVTRVPVGPGGEYLVAGLSPGSYELSVPGPGGTPVTRNVIVSVGQSAVFDFDAAVTEAGEPGADTDVPAGGVEGEANEIVVTGTRLVETRTSEVATNVSTEQIRTLPQTDRNFLSFAALAPGVRYNDSETDKGITSGASNASQVNVFIDGQSLKNNVTEGGVAGQQNSRGNPFAQVAVQEFRVLTQNYKAEYEQAGAATITAVTKSGTNEFHGEVFGSYTGRGLAETDFFIEKLGAPEPAFKRKQYGGALGGPIIADKLFFFAAYEGNDQDRAFLVQTGGSPEARASFEANSGRSLSEFEGAFVSPFRADLYFAKLTFQGGDRHTVDASFNRRVESDIQGFGGTASFEVAENKLNTVNTYNLRWTYRGDTFVNEASADYVDYVFNPTSLNPDLPTFDYFGVVLFGGKDSTRDVQQQGFTLRNDLSLTNVEWMGSHLIKMGIKYAAQNYEYSDDRFGRARFNFAFNPAQGLDFSFPFEAFLGLGNPNVKEDNFQLGMYIQDDWEVNDHLTLNLGLRWDYETDQFNNEYVTPQAARDLLLALPETPYFRGEDFISDGNDRPAFKGAFQPRLGFSYDVFADQRTVVFGGFGRYYDRNAFNNSRDELYREQFKIGQFFFSQDGLDRNGNPTVIFQDSFLTREGLLALQAEARTGLPELFAVENDARPPRTDQFSLGVRQKFGRFIATVTGSYIRGKNGFTNLFATRRPNGDCCDTSLANQAGFANVLIGVDDLDTRYKALYFKLEKPYTAASGWGVDVAYTLSKAEQNGGDLFSLDFPTPDEYGFYPRGNDERHLLVLSGILDLPLGFRFSTLSTFGSGTPFSIDDASQGFGQPFQVFRRNAGRPDKNCIGLFARCEVNVTLEKQFRLFDDHALGVAVDVFNAFNNKNFGGFNGFIPPEGQTNPNFGQPSNLISLPRRIQFRTFYRF